MITKRGPKPKYGNCLNCNKEDFLAREIYCKACYFKLLKNGRLERLPKKKLPDSLNNVQKEVLVGSLLGDGGLFKYKPKHKPYFAVHRAFKDKRYAEWQSDVFSNLICRNEDGSTFDNRTNKSYFWTKFITHRTNLFESYYQDWYPEGAKVVPENVVLSPLSIAVWIADDGYVRSVGKSPYRLQIKLSTHGFDVNSVETLCSLLCKRYNEYFGITLENKKSPIIYASDNATRELLKEIDGCFPESMSRKAYWRTPQACFYENIPKRSPYKKNNRKTKNGIRNKKE